VAEQNIRDNTTLERTKHNTSALKKRRNIFL
jgi:hypothetical protein